MLQPIVDLLHMVIQWCYTWTGDWGIAVILLTLLVRFMLLYLNFKQARNQLMQFRMRPEIEYIRDKHQKDQEVMMQETAKLYKHYRLGSSIWLSLLQMPIFMSLYQLFTHYGAVMTAAWLPWVETFQQADPLHLIPLLYALLSFITMLLPIVPVPNKDQSKFVQRLGMPLVFTIIMLFMFWRSPVALGLYWTMNAICNLGERLFYRSKRGNQLLNRGMPEPLFHV